MSDVITPLPVTAPGGEQRDVNDEKQLRHGREVHTGYPVGRFLQPPPFFFTRDKHPAPFVDLYRGGECFLIASGPSFGQIDKQKLAEPGILTMGLNNSPKTFRPDLWTCVDDPANFVRSIWLDKKIMKFAPISHIDKPIFNSDEWKFMDRKVGDCPNVWYYKRNERFKPEQYLYEDTINWGNHTQLGGGRSVLLAAIRILFLLGIRKIFLLGVDFDMAPDKKYHFEQERSASSIRGNNSTYKLLQERFTQLRPHFDAAGLEVFNCNPNSKLTAFDHMPFEEAYKIARGYGMPEDTAKERTEGLYDRKANEAAARHGAAPKPAAAGVDGLAKPTPVAKPCVNCSRKDVEHVKQQVNEARTALHEAKAKTASMRAMKESKDPRFVEAELTRLIADEDQKRKSFRRLVAIRNDMLGIK